MKVTAVFVLMAGAALLEAQAPERWDLVVAHRIGDASSPNTMFTDLRGVVASREGNVFVLESKTQDIRMFDAAGHFVKRVTRKGHGPGELIGANGMLASPSGGFVVNDPANGRITVWSPSGEYLSQIVSSSSYSAWVWQAGWDGDRIVEETTRRVPPPAPGEKGRHVSILRRIDFAGRADTVPFPSCRDLRAPATTSFTGARNRGPGMMIPFLGLQRFALDARGQFWCSPGTQYRVVRSTIGTGRTVDSIIAPTRVESIPKRERDSAIAVVDSFARKWPGGNADSKLIPTTRPAIEGLSVDDLGRLWVRRPALPTAGARFDVWSQGKLIGTIESPLRLAPEVPIMVVGDKFYAVSLDDDDVQTIVVATIRKAAR